jgi:long-chain acyl-CoA synthetase
MGGSSTKQIQYGVFTGEKKPFETQILRHPDYVEKDLLVASEETNTIWKAFQTSVKAHGNRPFLGTRKEISKDKYGDYEWKTYNQINEEVQNFARAIYTLDLCPSVVSTENEKFRFMGMYARNREEWIVADLASHLSGATVVTFYSTLGESTIEYILKQTLLTTIVMEGKALKGLVDLKKVNKSGNLQNIILLDSADENTQKAAVELGMKIYKFSEVLEAGKGKEVSFSPCRNDQMATFCYTSGTTGVPKGAMLSHGGIMSDVECLKYTSINFNESDVHLSYLPLAHVMERVVFTACMINSVAVGFGTGNPNLLMEDAQTLRPTIFLGVPRVYQRIYEVITTGISKLGFVKRTLANRAVSVKLDNLRKNGSLTHSVYDRLVFGKSKSALGGRVRLMITGSAPIAGDMLEYLKICFSCPIVEGYGATETCAGASVTHANDNIIGHVGGIVAGIELKLVDAEALNYKSTDVDEEGNPRPRGEICFRGPVLFTKYFQDPENTKNAIDSEGWLHTGDVGAIITKHGNALKIIDRIKNIFKLQHGEYVAPEKLENVLIKSPYVQQIFIYGDSLENYLVAVVVPKPHATIEFLQSKGIEATKENFSQFLDNKDLNEAILKDMESLGRRNDFKGFEVIKKCFLTNDAFTIENNMLTPTMKLKRNEAKAKYLDQLKKMYKA